MGGVLGIAQVGLYFIAVHVVHIYKNAKEEPKMDSSSLRRRSVQMKPLESR